MAAAIRRRPVGAISYLLACLPLILAEEVVPKNAFLVHDEALLLPEVPSKLNFDTVTDFASDNDTSAQLELRNSRYWGRMYVTGWPIGLQYFMAHFASPPPLGPRPLIVANPPDACEPLLNAKEIMEKDAFVLAYRGTCTFGKKARIVSTAKASGLIFINDRDGLEHPAGPDVHDLDFCSIMIHQGEGQLLAQRLYERADRGQPDVMARLIPIHCSAKNEKFRTNNLCEPVTLEERSYVYEENYDGGLIHSQGKVHEYLMAEFGSWVPTGPHKVVEAEPVDACHPLKNGDVVGKVVLVQRGGCPILNKALHVQQAGGVAVVSINYEEAIFRAGVQPRMDGLNVTIAVVTVTESSGRQLTAPVGSQGEEVTFEPHSGVREGIWKELQDLLIKSNWPRHPKKFKQLYSEMKTRVEGWPQRLAALHCGYSEVDPKGAEREEL